MRRAAAAVAACVFSVLLMAGKCDEIPSRNPGPCSTYQAPDGTWMEEDNEPVDSDPCDREPDNDKAPVVKLPTLKKAPVPIGGKTKKF